MRPSLVAATAALAIFVPFSAPAEEPDLSQVQCLAAYPEARWDVYGYNHEVPVVAEPDPTSIVTDELTILGRNAKLLCFGLSTYGRNYHSCGFSGVARAVSRNRYVFTEENRALLRFTILTGNRIRVEAVGEGHEDCCGTYGIVEPGIYDFRRSCRASSPASREPCP